MPGQPTFSTAGAYSSTPVPGVGRSRSSLGAGSTHTAFIIWLAVLGVALPIAILGGLKLGNYSFVFKGR